MEKERLLKLADLLDRDAKNKKGIKFDLGYWGYRDAAKRTTKPKRIAVDCGTTACAIGLACISGAFKSDGLTFKLVSKDNGGGNNFVPLYGGHDSFSAVQEFFGITMFDAHYLFSDTSYDPKERRGAVGERAVAKRIREFAA